MLNQDYKAYITSFTLLYFSNKLAKPNVIIQQNFAKCFILNLLENTLTRFLFYHKIFY